MKLYHRTTQEAAEGILAGGFKDATGTYMTRTNHTGVWLSDNAEEFDHLLDDGALLELDLPVAVVTQYEWVELGPNGGLGYREFLVPAHVLNAADPPRRL